MFDFGTKKIFKYRLIFKSLNESQNFRRVVRVEQIEQIPSQEQAAAECLSHCLEASEIEEMCVCVCV